ncbi:NAD(P)H-hydrate dehydratase [Desulfurispira natronophila]|uniref:Bifunctional NAD(P)H-hydrate repair enzyme n=1 Tax=Desulfurispira natronophila TaxID=682562 RepID=A0A7W7Y3U2_9BACT|nr:NAD(P)H-hydrate dehydratase [Desulfurispira natronophila]MBB5021596.1 NAD(P)H-hydrate epimerase [Desulfurispira natronophila]
MRILNAQQMAQMDRYTIHELGVPGLLLMENAGMAVVRAITERVRPHQALAILCGKGNNGGDGYVIARLLYLQGYAVTIFHAGRPSTDDSRLNYDIAQRLRIPVMPLEAFEPQCFFAVVDALFGTGLERPIEGVFASAVEAANGVALRFAVDIPSGVCGTTGRLLGTAFNAHFTVTMEYPKRGHYLYPGANLRGELLVAPIGISSHALPPEAPHLVDQLRGALPRRNGDSHKGTFGHLLCVGGTVGKAGAIRLGAKAAMETGCGLVSVASNHQVVQSLQFAEPEIMSVIVPCYDSLLPEGDSASHVLEHPYDAMVIGPGGGRHSRLVQFYWEVIQGASCPVVIDADALYCEDEDRNDILEAIIRRSNGTVLTPHPKEFERLTGTPLPELESCKLDIAREWALKLGCTLVLKGARTTVAWSNGDVYLLDCPNAALAKGGSGDVLAGIIGSLLAQGMDADRAALEGCKLHALAGQIMSQRHGSYSGGPLKHIQSIATAIAQFEEEVQV